MENLRSKVAKKTASFMRVAQQAPAPPPPAGPGGAPAPRAPMPPPPAPGGAAPAPPPPAGAPPASPRDMAEQNVQKQVEKDKMQEVKLDKLEQSVTKNNEQLESLVDAVVGMKEIMESTLLGEPGMDDKIKKLKEKQKTNEPTKDEFGLDEDKLIVSKEEVNMATAAKDFRQARKERLASELKHRPEKYSPEGLKFEDSDPENKKYKQEVPAPQITKVKNDETPELFRIALDLSDDESKWSVVDKTTEKVLFEINKTEANAKGFNTAAFARAIIADMKAMGLHAAMEKHAALPFPPMGDEKEGPKGLGGPLPQKKEDLKEKLMEKKPGLPGGKPGLGLKPPGDKGDKLDKLPELKIIKKDLPMVDKEEKEGCGAPLHASEKDVRRRFMRAFRLALSAQQKNLIDNPLKAAWFKALSSMGVNNPQLMIESTFTNAALDQFEVALQKTDEYLNLSDEAFIEAESTVGDFNTKITDMEPMETPRRESARAMQERAKKASLIVTTASDSDGQDRAAAIAQVLPTPKLAGISRFANQR
jgi:hypothetical protein